MGFFWKSDSDYIIEDVQELVGQINRQLSALQDTLVANNGATSENIVELGEIHERLAKLQNQVESKVNQLSSSKQAKLMVPWIDGRYFPYAMWVMSYNMAVNKLRIAVQRYANGI